MNAIQAVKNLLNNPNTAKAPAMLFANWIATDILRHLGPDPRAEVTAWLQANKPEVFSIIQSTFSHRL